MPTLAPCLDKLGDEVDARWPHRSRSSDGWLGDPAHAARKSDHNPDARGIVHARDITTAANRQGRRIRRVVKQACIGDERVWYVITNGYIYSKTHNWKRQKYTGPNAHKTHIHISVDYNRTDEYNRAPWNISGIYRRLFRRLTKIGVGK